jgi:hypothetical protein
MNAKWERSANGTGNGEKKINFGEQEKRKNRKAG